MNETMKNLIVGFFLYGIPFAIVVGICLGVIVSRIRLENNSSIPAIQLKHYDDNDYFQTGWHFRVCWSIRGIKHLCSGFHESSRFKAILNMRFVE